MRDLQPSSTKRGPGRAHVTGPGSRTKKQRAAASGGLTVKDGRLEVQPMRERLSGVKGLRP